jgi:hypothetical protein
MPKQAAAKPFLTKALERIVTEAVYSYHLLTARQITRLLYPSEKLGMFTTIKTRLKALTDAKYLTAAHLPTAEGVRPYVYCLGLAAKKYLRDEGTSVAIWFEKAELESRSPGWYYHILELNDFLITAAILEKSLPTLTLVEWEHDFTIAKDPPQSLKKDGKLAQVHPDGFLHLAHTITTADSETKTRHYRFLVELDRGTESDEKFKKKIRDYLMLSQQGALQERFHGQRLVYLFPTTAGARRVAKMRELAKRELATHDKTIVQSSYQNQQFKFASVPPLLADQPDAQILFTTPCWYVPIDGETDTPYSLIELS